MDWRMAYARPLFWVLNNAVNCVLFGWLFYRINLWVCRRLKKMISASFWLAMIVSTCFVRTNTQHTEIPHTTLLVYTYWSSFEARLKCNPKLRNYVDNSQTCIAKNTGICMYCKGLKNDGYQLTIVCQTFLHYNSFSDKLSHWSSATSLLSAIVGHHQLHIVLHYQVLRSSCEKKPFWEAGSCYCVMFGKVVTVVWLWKNIVLDVIWGYSWLPQHTHTINPPC